MFAFHIRHQLGDALLVVLCTAGYYMRWLMRAMDRLDLRALLLRWHFLAAIATLMRVIGNVGRHLGGQHRQHQQVTRGNGWRQMNFAGTTNY